MRIKSQKRIFRHKKIRARLQGTAVRPRLVVFRSLAHMEVQLIDDGAGRTLLSATDRNKRGNKTERAKALGAEIAKLILAKKITQVVFDRAGYKYHGRVKALAEAARQTGLKF